MSARPFESSAGRRCLLAPCVSQHRQAAAMVIVAMLPAAMCGYLLYLGHTAWAGCMFSAVCFLFALVNIRLLRERDSLKQMDDALLASEQRMREIVENLPTGAAYVEGENFYINRAVEEITGYSREQIPTLSAWFSTVYGERAEEVRAGYEKNRSNGFSAAKTVAITRKDGQVRHVEFVGYTWKTSEVWLIHDVRDRVSAQEGRALLSTIIDESSDFIGIIQPDRKVIYRNKAFRDLCGLDLGDGAGLEPRLPATGSSTFEQVYPAWALERIEREAIPAASATGHWQGEAALLRADGTEVPISLVIVAHRDKHGKVKHLSAVCRDMTFEKRIQEELHAREAQLHLALKRLSFHVEHSSLAFIESDAEGLFISWSPAAERIFGWRAEEVLGRLPTDVPFIHEDDLAHVADFRPRLLDGSIASHEWRIRNYTKDGRTVHCRWFDLALTGDDGELVALQSLVLDDTDRLRAEATIRESQASLQRAQALAHVGSWEGVWGSKELFVSEEMCRMIGLEPTSEPVTAQTLFSIIHPEDRDAVSRWFRGVLESLQAGDIEHRIVLPSGEVRYICTRFVATVQQATDSAKTMLHGTVLDVTERVKTLQEQTKFVSLVENCADFIAMLSTDGQILEINPAARAMLGICADGALGAVGAMTLSAFMSEDEWRRIRSCIFPTVLQQGRWEGAVRLVDSRTKEVRDMQASYFVIRDPSNGEPMCVATVQRDVTDQKRLDAQLKQSIATVKEQVVALERTQIEIASSNRRLEEANKRLEALATTDGLTGLKNHRAFQEELAREFKRSQRTAIPFSVVLLDVDDFKSYNDTFGHPEGDRVLMQVAINLQNSARSCDFVARYGGEEFVVILPDTGVEDAKRAGERLRAAIEEHPWEKRQVNASFGVTTVTYETSTTAELVDAADRALYVSKKSGRNRVTHADDIPVEEPAAVLGVAQSDVTELEREVQQLLARLKTHEQWLAADELEGILLGNYEATITSWSRLLELKDKETQGHSERVTEMTARLARRVGMNERELMYARWGARLHDIGKVGVPDSILLKPGPLTPEEWVVMKRHPVLANEMLSPIDFLKLAVDIPRSHHEKWDGSGYPEGLKGDAIPLPARLFAVIDVWDALRSDRPYRKGWEVEKVCDYLRANAGSHFDPRAVGAFLEMVEEDGDERAPMAAASPVATTPW